MKKNSILFPLSISFFSGALIATSYIPFPPWALFFCMVPLWNYWLSQDNLKKIIFSGWAAQFTLAIIGFNWICFTAHEYGKFNWFLSFCVMILFASISNLHFVISGVIWKISQRVLKFPITLSIIALGFISFLVETYFPMIFKWNFGYSWLNLGLQTYQLSDIIGFEGFSMITYLINAIVLISFKLKSKLNQSLIFFSLLIILISSHFFGKHQQKKWNQFDSELHVVQIQANIGNLDQYYAKHGYKGAKTKILEKYLQMTQKAIKQYPIIDLITWPEVAIPEFLNNEFSYKKNNYLLRKKIAEELKTPIITGGYSIDLKTRQYYNALFLFDKNGETPQTPYHKMKLLPFGEYLPLSGYFPKLKEIIAETGDFSFGKEYGVKQFKNFKLGFQICYESLFPNHTASLIEQGTDIIINATNDSWFGNYSEPQQHLIMTIARAIEFRRPLVRTTNTGYSTTILANGNYLESSGLNEEWIACQKIQFKKNAIKTFYAQNQYFSRIIAIIVLLLIFLASFFIKEKN